MPENQNPPVEYHFVLTLQTGDGVIVTQDGTIPINPGEYTRKTVFTALKEEVRAHFGISDSATVVFFSLAPNTI
ncbi:hypothetical protein [Streptomyces sp. NPDC048340]|uniref:hypothetical protein n=1 Tax=Streptomyces sp. NPDC048340 TaxID=3365537 RepID=UPI0037141F74